MSTFLRGRPTGLACRTALVAAGTREATTLRDGGIADLLALPEPRPTRPVGFVIDLRGDVALRGAAFGATVRLIRADGLLDAATRNPPRFGAAARAVFIELEPARVVFATALVRVVRPVVLAVTARVVAARVVARAGLLAALVLVRVVLLALDFAMVLRDVLGAARFAAGAAAFARTAVFARAVGLDGAARALAFDLETLLPEARARGPARVPPRVAAVRRPPARIAIGLARVVVPLVSSLLIWLTLCLSGAIRFAVAVRIGRSRFTCNLASRRPVSTKSSRYG